MLYYKGSWSLLLLSYSAKPNSTYLPKFLFFFLSLKKYLEIEIQEFVITWFNESGQLQLSNYLPTVKKVTKSTIPDYFKISRALGLPECRAKSPFTFVEQTWAGNDSNGAEQKREKIAEALLEMKEEFPKRLQQLTQLAKRLLENIPEELEILSEWHKTINWEREFELEKLETNHQIFLKLMLFEPDSASYKQVLSFLYPKLPILSSSITSLKGFKGVCELIRKLDINSFPESTKVEGFWDYLLSFAYSSFFRMEEVNHHSLYSKEGYKKLKKELLEIEWKVYYDFESYEDTLTQLSLQIFRGKELYLKENLILEGKEELEEFERELILKLATPLSQLVLELKELKKKVVYISFNKTFECEWLKKLFDKYQEKDRNLAILVQFIQLLTIDLSDWFKCSKNLSLNLIGPLEGAHSLKKLTKLVAEKKYSEIEMVQEGRTAQLLYFYFYLLEDPLSNKHLAPNSWIVKKRGPSPLKEQLKEYCELDVENMVLAVNWLKKEYKSQKDQLVSQEDILSFISYLKSQPPSDLAKLIKNYAIWRINYHS